MRPRRFERTFAAPGTPRRGNDPIRGSFLIWDSRNRKIRPNGLLSLPRVSSGQMAHCREFDSHRFPGRWAAKSAPDPLFGEPWAAPERFSPHMPVMVTEFSVSTTCSGLSRREWPHPYRSLAQPPLHAGPRDFACPWLSSLSSRWPNQRPCWAPNDKADSADAVRSFQRARSAGRLPETPTPRSARCQECGSAGTRFRASSGSLPDRRSARSRRGGSGRLPPISLCV